MHVLDNIVWNALTGPHRRFSIGTDAARRYEDGFPAFIAFPDPSKPDFAAIEPWCRPGQRFYVEGWSGATPDGWTLDFDGVMYQMVWEGGPPDDEAFDAIALTPDHAARAVELATLTRPGPFGPRNLDLGDYFGIFEGERLVAMAGERLAAGTYREVSAVCTHPDFQGRGLARRLMNTIIGRQMRRGATPFLHVVRTNESALGLYRRMGFAVNHEATIRVVSAPGKPA